MNASQDLEAIAASAAPIDQLPIDQVSTNQVSGSRPTEDMPTGDSFTEDMPTGEPTHGSRLIAKVISPAIRLWLRSQVAAVETLTFEIGGRDRQILRGHIPTVAVAAKQGVYQGLHLSQIELLAEQIRINLGQVLKGKPLRLLNVVPVTGQVLISQADLTASIAAPLLQQAIVEVLKLVLQQPDVNPDLQSALPDLQQSIELYQPQVELQPDRLILSTGIRTPTRQGSLKLATALKLIAPACLQLTELDIQYSPEHQTPITAAISAFAIDLGSEVALTDLTITAEAIACQGQINVIPAE